MKRLRRRFVLWVLPFVCAGILILSSFFIWDIEINGNETVSDTEILNALNESGVFIGSFWPSFTSENVRGRVMLKIPELKWLSVSVFGSHAHVEVRERTEIPELFDESECYKIVASQGGIIEEVYALRGTALFSVGETVALGDVIIDSAVDSTYASLSLVHAKGTVIARTWYELTAMLPVEYSEKTYIGGENDRFSLVVGGTRINFYKNSGILKLMCDNIITEHKLGIEGLFELPVSIIHERSQEYGLHTVCRSQVELERLLEAMLRDELLQSIGEDGQVLESTFTVSIIDGCAVGTLRAECRQNIAAEQPLTAAEIDSAKARSIMEDQNTE